MNWFNYKTKNKFFSETMFSIQNENELFNYVEIVLVKKKMNPNVYNIDFPETECTNIMQNLINAYPKNKVFKKHTTKYLYETLELVNCNVENTQSLYNLTLVAKKVFNSSYLVNYYQKQPLPTHSFPSTTNLYDEVDSKRVSMKIVNNVYVNFESLEYSDNTIYRHIYINVAINKATDLTHIDETLREIMKAI